MMNDHSSPNLKEQGNPVATTKEPETLSSLLIDDFSSDNSEHIWCVGDRVLARWLDLHWYPATILDIIRFGGERYAYRMLYDDGDQLFIPEVAILPLSFSIGEDIVITPKGAPPRVYVPAKITAIRGELLDVEYEDGFKESNLKVSRARIWRCPKPVPEFAFQEGDRVIARECDGFDYPGDIIEIAGNKIVVQYLSGQQCLLTPELIDEFNLNIGDRVECRWKGGETFYSGIIAEHVGERVFIAYDDGDKEWTNIRLLRIPRMH